MFMLTCFVLLVLCFPAYGFIADACLRVPIGKANFGRCSACSVFDIVIEAAQKACDVAKVLVFKQGRRDHLLLERADKLSYYYFPCKARKSATNLVSITIDKMDGNKNKCPSLRQR
eukprot:4936558-Pleurochrysis_carterae.AAC.1